MNFSSEVMIGIIVGSVFGGIVLLLLLGCVVYFTCCRKRWKDDNTAKPPPVIREHRNGHANSLYAAHPVKPHERRLDSVVEHTEPGKAIGYAYPIVDGRPVSFPPQSSASNPSSNGTKSSSPVKRTPSQLPPNAFRLPGLADKHLSMSDTNLSSFGTLNPAYDASDEVEAPRPVYRAQSLVYVSDTPDQRSRQAAYKLRTSSMDPRPMSTVYHYDGSLGRVISRNEQESAHSSRVVRELQPHRESDEARGDRRRIAQPPPPTGPPPRLPRVPLSSKAKEESPGPASPRKRSLTSELSYRAKGHIVTSEAFNFLDAFSDDPPKS